MNFLGRPASEWAIHRIFKVGIILKGLHSLLEILGGLVLLVVSTETIVRFAEILTRSELIEDPHDRIATFLLTVGHSTSRWTRNPLPPSFCSAMAASSWSWNAAIFSTKSGPTPPSCSPWSSLIAYQSYRMVVAGFSPALAALTVFDAIDASAHVASSTRFDNRTRDHVLTSPASEQTSKRRSRTTLQLRSGRES